MNKIENTPGPWKVAHQNGDALPGFQGLVGVVGPEQVNSMGNKFTLYVAQYIQPGDASVITASLELLEALRKFVAWHDMDHETLTGVELQKAYDEAIDAAKSAIKKATCEICPTCGEATEGTAWPGGLCQLCWESHCSASWHEAMSGTQKATGEQ